MFSSIGNFLYRHRRKFLFTGITVGGITLLSKYAEHKLHKWQEESTRKILLQQRRKTHYERTLNATRVMLLELMPNLRKIIEKEVDTESVVEALKERPDNKRELWKKLIHLSFARTICSIVSMAFAAPVAHVVMMVLSSRTLDVQDDSSKMASPEIQAQYLACFQNLIEEQMSVLVSRIVKIVEETLGDISLTTSITLPVLESYLQRITLAVTSDKASYASSQGAAYIAPTVLPWSQYLKSPEPICGKAEANKLLKDMHFTTLDVLSTDDFSDVVNTLVQVGMNFVLDEFAHNNLYTLPRKQETDIPAYRPPKIPADEGEIYVNPSDGLDTTNHESLFAGPRMTTTNNVPHEEPFDVNKCSVVLCKMAPILSGMPSNILPDPQKVHLVPEGVLGSGYYNRLVVCSQLEALSFNVYDALITNSCLQK